MMPRKFCDEDLDQAEELRRRGEKWVVVESLLGEGIRNACAHRARANQRKESDREQFIRVLQRLGVVSPWDQSQAAFVDRAVNLAWRVQCAIKKSAGDEMKNGMISVGRDLLERCMRELERGIGPGPRNRAEELRALLAEPRCSDCGKPTACGKMICEDCCYTMPATQSQGKDFISIPLPEVTRYLALGPTAKVDAGGDEYKRLNGIKP